MTSLLEQAYVDLITEREIKQLDFLLKSVYAASLAGGLTDEATERLQRVVDKRRAEAKLQPRRRLSLIVDNVRPYVNLTPAAVVPPALPENTWEHYASLIPCEAAATSSEATRAEAEIPRYLLRAPFFDSNLQYHRAGEIVEHPGVPNGFMEPLNEVARQCLAAWRASLPGHPRAYG